MTACKKNSRSNYYIRMLHHKVQQNNSMLQCLFNRQQTLLLLLRNVQVYRLDAYKNLFNFGMYIYKSIKKILRCLAMARLPLFIFCCCCFFYKRLLVELLSYHHDHDDDERSKIFTSPSRGTISRLQVSFMGFLHLNNKKSIMQFFSSLLLRCLFYTYILEQKKQL